MSLSATKGQIEEFFEASPVWNDIEEELELWLDEIHMQLENLEGSHSPRILDRLGGNAEAIRSLLGIEETLLNTYKIEHGGLNNG